MSCPYKHALLGYPNGNEFEAQKGANETMKEDVNETLSDNRMSPNLYCEVHLPCTKL